MKMKVIALGMLSMFLLSGLLVGTASSADLQVEIYGWGKNDNGGYAFLAAEVTNIGSTATAGQVDLYLSKKGPVGLMPIPIQRTLLSTTWKLKWTICESDERIMPGESVYEGNFNLMTMGSGGLFSMATYQYSVNVPAGGDDNIRNNIASQRVLTKIGYMYFL